MLMVFSGDAAAYTANICTVVDWCSGGQARVSLHILNVGRLVLLFESCYLALAVSGGNI